MTIQHNQLNREYCPQPLRLRSRTAGQQKPSLLRRSESSWRSSQPGPSSYHDDCPEPIAWMLWEGSIADTRHNASSMSTDTVVLTEEDLFEYQYDDHDEQASEQQDPASPERSPGHRLVLTRSSDLFGWEVHLENGLEGLSLDECHLPFGDLASSPEHSPRSLPG